MDPATLLVIVFILLIAMGGTSASITADKRRTAAGLVTVAPGATHRVALTEPLRPGSYLAADIAGGSREPAVVVTIDGTDRRVAWPGRYDTATELMSTVVPEAGLTVAVTPANGEVAVSWTTGRDKTVTGLPAGRVQAVAFTGAGIKLGNVGPRDARASGTSAARTARPR